MKRNKLKTYTNSNLKTTRHVHIQTPNEIWRERKREWCSISPPLALKDKNLKKVVFCTDSTNGK